MKSAAELLRQHGITLTDTKPGRHYTTCPRCSKDRKKPGHKNAECLGVTIDSDGVPWGCNHCGWTGPEKGGGDGKTELPSYIYRDRDGVIRFRKVRNRPGREPRFWLEQPDGKGGWKKGTKGVDTKLIYRADELKGSDGGGSHDRDRRRREGCRQPLDHRYSGDLQRARCQRAWQEAEMAR